MTIKFETQEEKLAKALTALKALEDAAYSILCESNGIFDNGWRRVRSGGAEGEFDWEMECPIASFGAALEELGDARQQARAVLDPEEVEREQRWAKACETARHIVDRYKEDKKNPRIPSGPESSLHRNIADAIYGILRAEDGKLTGTMDDRLKELVENGELVQLGKEDL